MVVKFFSYSQPSFIGGLRSNFGKVWTREFPSVAASSSIDFPSPSRFLPLSEITQLVEGRTPNFSSPFHVCIVRCCDD